MAMIDEKKLDFYLNALGFPENGLGVEYLKQAVRLHACHCGDSLFQGDFFTVQRIARTPVSAIKNYIRLAIEASLDYGDVVTKIRVFGYDYSRRGAVPTVEEFVFRLAYICKVG